MQRMIGCAFFLEMACVALSGVAAEPVLRLDFEGGTDAVGVGGRTVKPVVSERIAFAPGLDGQALRADSARLVYPASVIPVDRGTIEVVVSPLSSGTGPNWMFFCGDASSWAAVGMPRLWRWNGNPRFDMDGGGKSVHSGPPAWCDWSPGTWHTFTGTWDREAGKVRLFLNGVFLGGKKTEPWPPGQSEGFAVGANPHIGGDSVNYARALIDSLTVFDRVLSLAEIAHRSQQLGIAPPSAPHVPMHPAWSNALTPAGTPGADLLLADAGRTEYTILTPSAPSDVETKAAADLSRWLREMSGVSLPVAREGAAPVGKYAISVGATERRREAGVSGADRDLGLEGYGIDARGRDLYLWGGSGRGVVNAVYAFLEEDLGCRWYARGTVSVPHRTTVRVAPTPRTFVPVLEIRDPFYWDAFEADWSLRNRTNAPSAAVPEEFGGRVRYAGGFFVHTYNRLVPPSVHFKEHPEYYSEIGGKRVARQLCVTHPDVVRISIEKVLSVLRADPTAQLISVSPNDGRGYCECATCRALDDAEGGTQSATLLTFVNAVADAIRDEFPHVKVSTLAYLDTVQPPKTIRPRDNVVIRLCTDRHAWSHFFEFVTETDEFSTAMKAWAEIGAKIHIWDYTVNFSHYSLPSPNLPVVSQNVRWMMAHNARGIMLQGAYQGPGAARGPMRAWVWGKQLWDPTLNTRDLIRDFTYGFYGKAAEPMQAYNELLWRLWEREYMGALRPAGNIRHPPTSDFLTREFAAEGTKLFADAESLAAGDAELIRRVRLAEFALLYLKLSRGPDWLEEDYGALCTEFAATAKRERVTHLWEGGLSKESHVDEKLRYWRGLAKAQNARFSCVRIGPQCMFRPDPGNAGEKQEWFAADYADLEWARIAGGEDGGWNKQGFPDLTGTGWYRIRFDVPPQFGTGRKVRLFVGAADEDAVLYLNGTKVFEHTCESTGLTPEKIWDKPFLFDPGEALKPGGENLLAVRIHNRLGMGGLWQPLYLLAVDEDPPPSVVIDMVRLKEERQGGE